MRIPFFFPLLLFLGLSSWSARAVKRSAEVNVGVILDTSTWIGNVSWSCMPMALEDFYAAHPNYTTRVSLHLRNTDQTSFDAASSALDLLENVQVQAIIGPQSSRQAKFVLELGDKAHVPIISFSAKSPSLSHQKYPYFIRTSMNDSSQSKVIAQITQAFKWRELVPIFEDTDYGNGIIPYLIDALQEVEARVPYRSSIPPSANDDQILKELRKLKRMQTRVFVVHMAYSLGFRLFSLAKEAGMMEKGYVWITTYGLTDLIDLMGSSASDVMQGVLGVKPYVRETEKLRDFQLRWRKKFDQKDINAGVSQPTVFGLWAYDTVWSLALAAETAGVTFQGLDVTNSSTGLGRLGSSLTGRILRDKILNIKFDGMSGEFLLKEGQLESNAFEIVNIVGHGKKTVGFWTPEHGISGRVDMKDDLKDVAWPGYTKATKAVPKGWQWPTNKTGLRIGIPVKPGFSEFVRMEMDPKTAKKTAKGYCIEVFDAVMAKMPYHVPYHYVAFEDAKGESNGTYDELVYQVHLQNFDAVVGDVTIIANRSLYVDFTLPYTESGVSMVVPVKDQRRKNAWTFLEPLTTDLWLVSGVFFMFTGFVVWMLEHRMNEEFRGAPSHQLGTVLYFAFSTLVFSHREKVVNNLSRVVIVIWLFVVLVLQSSYTASLTSMLTVQQLQPTVNNVDDIIKSGAKVGYLNDSFMPGLLKRLNVNESKLIAYESPEEYDKAMSNGSVAAIVDEIPYIKVFLSKYCNKYTKTGPTYKTDGFGFTPGMQCCDDTNVSSGEQTSSEFLLVFPKGSPLVPDVSRAILLVTEEDKMNSIENELYGDHSCPDQDSNSVTSSSLTFNSFWGLFLITGISSISALILHLARFIHKHRDMLRSRESNNSVHQRLTSLAKVYDQMDPSHAPKKPEEATEGQLAVNFRASPYVSEPQSPSCISNHALENFEHEVGETLTDGDEEEEESPGREITRENPDAPSFADMLPERTS